MNIKFDTKEIEESLKKSTFPKILVVETSSYCNLKCILCPQGSLKREKGIMDMEIFKKIVDEVSFESPSTSLWVALMGEPLMYSDKLIKMIRYAKIKGVEEVNLNTNGLLLNSTISQGLIEARLDKILISIDGFKPSTYESIRVGGNYDVLMRSIGYLLEMNNVYGNPLEIIAQFIVMEENESEVEAFKKFWLEQGVTVKIRPKLSWGHAIESKNLSLTQNDRSYPCPWLIRTASIHWSGKFGQCDADFEGNYSPGDFKTQSIKEIWNGELKERRNRHWKGDYSHPLCKECRDWQVGRALFYRR